MRALYIVGGIASLIFGLVIIIRQIKTFKKGEQDELGFDIKLLGGGMGFLMIGIYLFAKYI